MKGYGVVHGGLLGGLLLLAVNACAEELDPAWLKIVAFAAHQTEYSGIFVYQFDNRVETSRITHIVEPDSEYEKLERLDGPKREIIRHHGQMWCSTDRKMIQVDSQQGRKKFPSLLPDQLTSLSANYQIKGAGQERVAGYNTQVILFQPKDNLRYTRKIWAHTDSGLLLKAAVLGDKNQVVEQYSFTQLQIGGGIDRSWITSFASGAGSASGKAGSELASPGTGQPVNSGWIVDTLPAGFKKTLEISRPMRGKRAPVTQIVFSDGLSAISVFIEPADEDEVDLEGLSSRGAVNLYHKLVDRNLITVVGEVPPRTVIRTLESVRYNGK